MHHPTGLLIGTAALLLSFSCPPAKAQVTFKPFAEFCLVSDMSADGGVAVGSFDDGIRDSVFRWTPAGGVELIGSVGPRGGQFNDAYVSRDGQTIVGTMPDSQGNYHAAIWQGGRNWRILGPFPGAIADGGVVSVAKGVSADGSVVVGNARVGPDKIVAFRWDAMNGMVNLGMLDEGANNDSDVYAVSGDGRTIVGYDAKHLFQSPGPNGGGMNHRRGAIWWEGKERLIHPYGWAGEAWATNDVGSIIVGQFHPMDSTNRLQGAGVYMWTAWDGHFEDLGAVRVPIGEDQRNFVCQPFAVSDDGSVIGGETGLEQKWAMIWTRQTGMMRVADFLTMNGVTEHNNWLSLVKTVYISPDGRVAVGEGFLPPGPTSPFPVPRSWVMTLR